MSATSTTLRGRRAAEALMADTCTIQHPTSLTTDPDTGVVTRGSTGTITRPHTGTVTRPCSC